MTFSVSPRFRYLIVAIVLMVLVKFGLWKWEEARAPEPIKESVMPAPDLAQDPLSVLELEPETVTVLKLQPAQRQRHVTAKPMEKKPVAKERKTPPQVQVKETKIERRPAQIVIIIDDMGMNRKNTLGMIDLKAPLTLSFLPYAPHLEEYTQAASGRGHELMIHVPMEPVKSDISLGGMGLTTQMSQAAITERLEEEIFPAFGGYKGINNHMGSKLTQDKERMVTIMSALRARGLYFVDSKTIQSSVAAETAEEEGVAHAVRDVFLDHYEGREAVEKALLQLEKKAYQNGIAVAIGHPKDHTLAALKAWLPTLQEKQLSLVPASKAVSKPDFKIAHTKDVRPADPPTQAQGLLAHPEVNFEDIQRRIKKEIYNDKKALFNLSDFEPETNSDPNLPSQ